MQVSGWAFPIAMIARFIAQHVRIWYVERAVERLFPRNAQRSMAFSVPYYETRYVGDISHFIDWEVFFFGAHEFVDTELLRQVARAIPDCVALDVGANIGDHTLALAPVCAHVHAIEPFMEACDELRRKMSATSLSNVSLHKMALSDVDSKLPFASPPDRAGGTGSFARGQADTKLEVRIGDVFLAEVGIDRIDLIKIDIEGHEPAALKGLLETISRKRPIVMMELNFPPARFVGLFPGDYVFLCQVSVNRLTQTVRLIAFDLNMEEDPSPARRNIFAVPPERLTIFGDFERI